ncbi:GapS1 family protein [Pseudomonas syringae]|uniref:GapS1 family protein n=1 Tax=Pseudomonas syringae TaxID=317 RepID=UPI003F74D18A
MAGSLKAKSDFDDGFLSIQQVIRRYSPLSILVEALRYLYSPVKDPVEQASKHPWLIMLLIKWTFVDPLADAWLPRPDITPGKLHALLQEIYDLSDTGSRPDEYEDVRLFMRALAYQQFLHQTENGLLDIARQVQIFARVPENHYFKTRFLRGLGVSISDFLRLAFAVIAIVKKPEPIINRETLFELCPPFAPATVNAFLSAISIDVQDLPRELRAVDLDLRHANEFLLQTPLLRFPLIKVGGQYWCVSPHVLERSLGHFIYDYLKRVDVGSFNSPFGKSFERYVGEQIERSGLAWADENELLRALPGQGKVVDFIVADGDANVLIDAKGVEMAQRGMAALRRGDVRRATQTSLIKAFEQGHEVAARVAAISNSHPVIHARPSTYLLAVTYKELYIGNGITLAGVIGESELTKIRMQYDPRHLIPDENIYFLTVREFEELMSLVRDGKIGLVEALNRAKQADSNPLTHKFNFELHIAGWPEAANRKSPLQSVLQTVIDEMRRLVTRSA